MLLRASERDAGEVPTGLILSLFLLSLSLWLSVDQYTVLVFSDMAWPAYALPARILFFSYSGSKERNGPAVYQEKRAKHVVTGPSFF